MKPDIEIGQVYKTRDRRDAARRIRVLENVGPYSWLCETVSTGKRVKLSSQNIQRNWDLAVEEIRGPLPDLLRAIKTAAPHHINSAVLRRARTAWLDAGSPGL